MFNRNCLHCGSRYTYAVPSRAKIKVGEDGKVMADEQGLALKVMCRRCRNCGLDYFEDDRAAKNRAPSETEQKMLEAVRKYQEDKEKKKIQ